MLFAAITALTAVIGVLWAQTRTDYKMVLHRLEVCEDDRKQLWEKLAGLESKIRNGHKP